MDHATVCTFQTSTTVPWTNNARATRFFFLLSLSLSLPFPRHFSPGIVASRVKSRNNEKEERGGRMRWEGRRANEGEKKKKKRKKRKIIERASLPVSSLSLSLSLSLQFCSRLAFRKLPWSEPRLLQASSFPARDLPPRPIFLHVPFSFRPSPSPPRHSPSSPCSSFFLELSSLRVPRRGVRAPTKGFAPP